MDESMKNIAWSPDRDSVDVLGRLSDGPTPALKRQSISQREKLMKAWKMNNTFSQVFRNLNPLVSF